MFFRQIVSLLQAPPSPTQQHSARESRTRMMLMVISPQRVTEPPTPTTGTTDYHLSTKTLPISEPTPTQTIVND